MDEPWKEEPPPLTEQQYVGAAIQDMIAMRLARGFVPLVLLLVVGLVGLLRPGAGEPGALVLAVGSLATGAAMLAYGQRVVLRAFGRPDRPWMTAAMLGSLLPPAFSLYVLGWLGLRELALAGWGGLFAGVFYAAAGTWVLRAWMKVVEVERLAQAMIGTDGPREPR